MISTINLSTKVDEFENIVNKENLNLGDATLFLLVDLSENFINKESLNLRDGGTQDVENLTISLE